MAEISLSGHKKALENLANETIMTEAGLANHIMSLEAYRKQVVEIGIGKRSIEADQLLVHFRFEAAMRSGKAQEKFGITSQIQEAESKDAELV